MDWPSPNDFLDALNILPEYEDGHGLFRYIYPSNDRTIEVDLSFDVVARSFQAVLRCHEREISRVCSELVSMVQLRRDKSGSSVHVEFEIDGAISRADIWLEPDVRMCWSTLRK